MDAKREIIKLSDLPWRKEKLGEFLAADAALAIMPSSLVDMIVQYVQRRRSRPILKYFLELSFCQRLWYFDEENGVWIEVVGLELNDDDALACKSPLLLTQTCDEKMILRSTPHMSTLQMYDVGARVRVDITEMKAALDTEMRLYTFTMASHPDSNDVYMMQMGNNLACKQPNVFSKLDLSTRRWQVLALPSSLQFLRGAAMVMTCSDNRVYIVNHTRFCCTLPFFVFHIPTQKWKRIQELRRPGTDRGYDAPPCLLVHEGFLFAVVNGHDNKKKCAWLHAYYLATRSWHNVDCTSFNLPDCAGGIFALDNGDILITDTTAKVQHLPCIIPIHAVLTSTSTSIVTS
jgi:hypothetical protein